MGGAPGFLVLCAVRTITMSPSDQGQHHWYSSPAGDRCRNHISATGLTAALEWDLLCVAYASAPGVRSEHRHYLCLHLWSHPLYRHQAAGDGGTSSTAMGRSQFA